MEITLGEAILELEDIRATLGEIPVIGAGHVYLTMDGGEHKTGISEGEEDLPISAVVRFMDKIDMPWLSMAGITGFSVAVTAEGLAVEIDTE